MENMKGNDCTFSFLAICCFLSFYRSPSMSHWDRRGHVFYTKHIFEWTHSIVIYKLFIMCLEMNWMWCCSQYTDWRFPIEVDEIYLWVPLLALLKRTGLTFINSKIQCGINPEAAPIIPQYWTNGEDPLCVLKISPDSQTDRVFSPGHNLFFNLDTRNDYEDNSTRMTRNTDPSEQFRRCA